MEAVLDEIDLTEDLRDARVAPPRLSVKATDNSNRNYNSLDDLTRNAGIMIIDDEAYNVLVVRKFLQHAGYLNFVTTTESPKAINLMKQDMPDVVLLDVMMPGIDGCEVCV